MHTTPRCGNVSSQRLQLYEAARAEVVKRVKGCDGLTGMDKLKLVKLSKCVEKQTEHNVSASN